MAFLLQVYCPAGAPHAFHRALYVFVCRKGNCSKINTASNFAVFRCQLPRENAFYSVDAALCPSAVGEMSDPFFDLSVFARLCVVCGCRASKRCARCVRRWYCGREHQIIDWNFVHKSECVQQPEGNVQNDENSQMKSEEKAEQRAKHGFAFKEFGIELCSEEDEDNDDDGANGGERSDDESGSEGEEGGGDMEVDGDGGTEEENRRKMVEFEKIAEANGVSARDVDGLEESRRDIAFGRFSAALARYPEQILRYRRAGIPLLATDHSPRPPPTTPSCERCGAPRQFELQLMPNLVALLELDTFGQSVDWATLMVYTCRDSCPLEGYAREFVFKQDFVVPEAEESDGKNAKNRDK
uniref:MYND-type domain-containing protein n=1 Tax=Globodera pallida TaxID=36090 RepID=A0A183CD92_GLOPA